jgi:alkylated DNA repair dioxygenase AlkB
MWYLNSLMVQALQGSLLGLGSQLEIGALGDELERTSLANGAWVDLRRGWIEGADLLFERLVDEVPWIAERRQMYDRTVDVPRLHAFYDDADPLPDVLLPAMRDALRAQYRSAPGGDLRTAGLCLYRDGRDSVAWHGDRFGRGSYEDTVVAIISLGSTRTLLLRPRGGGSSQRYPLYSGDLLVMGGSCQRTWEHAIPKTTRPVGPRISVQFRPVGVR